MSYKMIVLDLDGTLMSSKNEILPKTKEALFKAQENGVMIVLASGRPTYGMIKAAKELRLDEYKVIFYLIMGDVLFLFKPMK